MKTVTSTVYTNKLMTDTRTHARTHAQRTPDITRSHKLTMLLRSRQFWASVVYVGGGALGLVMGPCIVEIYRIVLRDVQYQFEVNRCRNEEVIVKGNFRWAWSIWAGAPQIEIDCIVIRDVQYQFEVNRCRNEEDIKKGNFGSAWSMWAGAPQVEIDCIVIRDVGYQLEVNQCRNEEVNVKLHKTRGPEGPKPPLGNHVFQANIIIFELIQDIIETNLLTKFHEDWTINVASRVFTWKNAPPLGSHTNLLTKFHEDWTINVASRVENAPPLGSYVFQANVTIFELIQDIIETNLLTKFHKDWK
ncbi:hypothetical protein DPMN_140870 [Dreissena polymorpha]|uniref:Uncharacterized protein n=1 Tax=Dreissena polymorpha TaxID=45954 RepID=A0A9D4G8J2_DREPO|nr:hypothetical protein DPMN_140870 [Dreissena polymorpha]